MRLRKQCLYYKQLDIKNSLNCFLECFTNYSYIHSSVGLNEIKIAYAKPRILSVYNKLKSFGIELVFEKL